MTEGLINTGFRVIAAVEIDKHAAQVYRINHKKHNIALFENDIRTLDTHKILELLNREPIHLLAGCPPCQGFSSLRRKNKKRSYKDTRNNLVLEYLRFVEELQPIAILFENVPGIKNYNLFKKVYSRLKTLGYNPNYSIVDMAFYGVPQRRKRLVMMGSLLGKIEMPTGNDAFSTVFDFIGKLESVENTTDSLHKRFPHHTNKVMQRIKLTPHDGGSRKDLPKKYILKCHKQPNTGFHDIYGRLKWNNVSSTITGGCLNPSKGRFIHPDEDRCITAREAALLQTFRQSYIFPNELPLSKVALLIGNALPPKFCKIQGTVIKEKLDVVFMADIFDKDKRSEIMRRVKNKNTTPEKMIRKILTQMGYRYRLNTKILKCKPDIVFPSQKKAIFINGCFWHGHYCKRGQLPETNTDFWARKISQNIERDKTNYSMCLDNGWSYLVLWGCEIKNSKIDILKTKLLEFLSGVND